MSPQSRRVRPEVWTLLATWQYRLCLGQKEIIDTFPGTVWNGQQIPARNSANPHPLPCTKPMESQSRLIVTFLGCPVSAQVTARLQRWCQAAAPQLTLPSGSPVLRWTRPESLHITLHYLGPTEQAAALDCQSVLGEMVAEIQEIPVHLQGLALFPQSRQTGGLWVEVTDPTGALAQLHANLSRTLQQLGLPASHRRFRPHVTLGRIAARPKSAVRREAAAILQRVVATRPLARTADTIALVHWYQSIQQPGGNRYPPLATWRLKTPVGT